MKRDSCINLITGHRLVILNYFQNKLINNVQYLLFPGQLTNHYSHKSQQLLRCLAALDGPDSRREQPGVVCSHRCHYF